MKAIEQFPLNLIDLAQPWFVVPLAAFFVFHVACAVGLTKKPTTVLRTILLVSICGAAISAFMLLLCVFHGDEALKSTWALRGFISLIVFLILLWVEGFHISAFLNSKKEIKLREIPDNVCKSFKGTTG